jgi:hypothetical protein
MLKRLFRFILVLRRSTKSTGSIANGLSGSCRCAARCRQLRSVPDLPQDFWMRAAQAVKTVSGFATRMRFVVLEMRRDASACFNEANLAVTLRTAFDADWIEL